MTRALRQPIESYGVRGFHHGLRPATSMVSAGCSRNNFVPHCLVANGPNGITSFCQVPSQRSISPEFDRSRMGRLPCLVPAILFAWTPSLSTGTVTLSMSILLTSRPATFPHHRGCSRPPGAEPKWCAKCCWPRRREDAHGQRHFAQGKRGRPSKKDRWDEAWKSAHARTIDIWRSAPLRRYLTESGDSFGSVR